MAKERNDLPAPPKLADHKADPKVLAAESRERDLSARIAAIDAQRVQLQGVIDEAKAQDQRRLHSWSQTQVEALAAGTADTLAEKPAPISTDEHERQLADLGRERQLYAEALGRVQAQLPELRRAAFEPILRQGLEWAESFRARAIEKVWALRAALFAEADVLENLAADGQAAGVKVETASPLRAIRQSVWDHITTWLALAVQGGEPLMRSPFVQNLLAAGPVADEVAQLVQKRASHEELQRLMYDRQHSPQPEEAPQPYKGPGVENYQVVPHGYHGFRTVRVD
jgi:hypothetical protein